MEQADKSVSIDLLTRANLSLGVKATSLNNTIEMVLAENTSEYKLK